VTAALCVQVDVLESPEDTGVSEAARVVYERCAFGALGDVLVLADGPTEAWVAHATVASANPPVAANGVCLRPVVAAGEEAVVLGVGALCGAQAVALIGVVGVVAGSQAVAERHSPIREHDLAGQVLADTVVQECPV